MQALMLAAGMGKRLGKYTKNNTKCMVEVAGLRFIDRAINALELAGIKKMIIVVGYCGDNLIEYVNNRYKNSQIKFEFINNKEYATTNNIFSFYMAKDYLINDDTLLMESDLVYDPKIIKNLIDAPQKDVAVVAKLKSWMDGTVVTRDGNGYIKEFVEKSDIKIENYDDYYKTVNIYKLSKEFCENVYIPFLEAYIKAYGMDSYYETTLKVIAHLSKTKIYGYEIGDLPWYEIDDALDLDVASIMFNDAKDDSKYNELAIKYGGYWKYPGLKDFCYLVNPYFPPKTMIQKMQRELPELICSYPSGLAMENKMMSRIFRLPENYVIAGNGAAELINALGKVFVGKKVAVGVPTFNEYVRCFDQCEIIKVDNSKHDYQFSVLDYCNATKENDVLCIVNPDNPSGALISYNDMLQIIKQAEENDCILVVDESFIDFADADNKYTLLNEDLLLTYPNLIVIKSLGKSFGVGGLRLGVAACSNPHFLDAIKSKMQIWGINSFAEYFLQIFNIYEKEYAESCKMIADERRRMIRRLSNIDKIKVYDSQANFILVDLKDISSRGLCANALNKANIFLKDLSTKDGFKGKNYIRVAIKSKVDNDYIMSFIEKEISEYGGGK